MEKAIKKKGFLWEKKLNQKYKNEGYIIIDLKNLCFHENNIIINEEIFYKRFENIKKKKLQTTSIILDNLAYNYYQEVKNNKEFKIKTYNYHNKFVKELIKHCKDKTILYQVKLKVSKDFIPKKYKINIPACEIDYLEIMIMYDGNTIVNRIIDAKSSKYMKLSHKIQVAFYALVLDNLNIPFHSNGCIYLPNKKEEFNLNNIKQQLKYLLHMNLPNILNCNTIVHKYKIQTFHYCSNCASCDFKNICIKDIYNGDISGIQNINFKDKILLQGLLYRNNEVCDIEDIGNELCGDIKNLYTILKNSTILQNSNKQLLLDLNKVLDISYNPIIEDQIIPNIGTKLSSLYEKKIKMKSNAYSNTFPNYWQKCITISVQFDPMNGDVLYHYTLLLKEYKNTNQSFKIGLHSNIKKKNTEIITSSNNIDNILLNFITDLYHFLFENQSNKNKTIIIMFYSKYELNMLIQKLLDFIMKTTITNIYTTKAYDLCFYLLEDASLLPLQKKKDLNLLMNKLGNANKFKILKNITKGTKVLEFQKYFFEKIVQYYFHNIENGNLERKQKLYQILFTIKPTMKQMEQLQVKMISILNYTLNELNDFIKALKPLPSNIISDINNNTYIKDKILSKLRKIIKETYIEKIQCFFHLNQLMKALNGSDQVILLDISIRHETVSEIKNRINQLEIKVSNEIEIMKKGILEQQKQLMKPSICIIENEIHKLFVLPIPSYFTFIQAYKQFCCKENEIIDDINNDIFYAYYIEQAKTPFYDDENIKRFHVEDEIVITSQNSLIQFGKLKVEYLFNLFQSIQKVIDSSTNKKNQIIPNTARKFIGEHMTLLNDPILSQQAFICQLELLAKHTKLCNFRLQSIGQQLQLGTILIMKCNKIIESSNNGRPKKVIFTYDFPYNCPSECKFLQKINENYFASNLLFCLLKNISYCRNFRDILYYADREITYGIPNIVTSNIISIDNDNKSIIINISNSWWCPKKKIYYVKEGDMCVIQERLCDYNSNTILNHYRRLNDELMKNAISTSLVQVKPFISNVLSWNISMNHNAKQFINNSKEKYNMTISQENCFESLLSNKLCYIKGAPGSGKTHFSASTIARLFDYHKTQQKPFHVLITAYTNKAIDNLMDHFVKLNMKYNILKYERKWAKKIINNKIIRLGRPKSNTNTDKNKNKTINIGDTINSYNKTQKLPMLSEYHVIGCTVYSYETNIALKNDKKFDFVVIDEASQMPLHIGGVVLNALKPDGKILVVGDTQQMSPVYSSESNDYQYSIMKFIENNYNQYVNSSQYDINLVKNYHFMRRLEENHRMNDTLAYITKQLVYEYYEPYEKSKTSRNTEIIFHNEFIKCDNNICDSNCINCIIKNHIFNNDFKLNIIHLKNDKTIYNNDNNNQLKAYNTEAEAYLVAKIVTNFIISCSQNFQQDQSQIEYICNTGIFVVTPHHFQKIAVTNQLKKELHAIHQMNLYDYITVGTVECMQGQEADFVIACYGISSKTFNDNEYDFIYSRNRLNVSITRAKRKVLLITNEDLLITNNIFGSSMEVYSNQEREDGYLYLFNLINANIECIKHTRLSMSYTFDVNTPKNSILKQELK